eukprot:6205774-Pleurochrysis_carterae.AAC.4
MGVQTEAAMHTISQIMVWMSRSVCLPRQRGYLRLRTNEARLWDAERSKASAPDGRVGGQHGVEHARAHGRVGRRPQRRRRRPRVQLDAALRTRLQAVGDHEVLAHVGLDARPEVAPELPDADAQTRRHERVNEAALQPPAH